MPLYDLVAQVEKKTKTKTKKTRQRTIYYVTNLSPFDKSMIDKSEDLNGN